MEIMASADNLSVFVVERKKVFILFNVEKQRSGSAVVIGVVSTIFKSLITSGKTSFLSSSEANECNKSNNFLLGYKSLVENTKV